ncbi:MAG: D-inositol 3-phosphate glycosyltransferase [Planctomycetes bacterium ADurb.Bin126]|nr:MAG: D-inositol 3-phosphate glycosyltransferase [Planctomycetes bacterium ADurb.Bin126]HOD82879.1 glycosyltransferase [Phycisphaerae bacterium]HQL75299.1 glycosyltransferase [Phycisphaerae bacterium]
MTGASAASLSADCGQTACSGTSPVRMIHLVLSLDIGGLENLVWQMTERAPEFGLSTDVACMDHGGFFADEIRREGVEVFVANRKGGLDLGSVLRLARFCVRRGVRLVHSHSGCMLYAALLGWTLPYLKIVHTDHGRHHPDWPIVCSEERVAIRRIDRLVSVSHTLAGYLRQVVRLPADMDILWNGVNVDTFQPPTPDQRADARQRWNMPADARVVGTVGRMSPVKNHPLLLRAFKRVSADRPELRLLLVGEGDERPALMALAGELGIADRTCFTGRVDAFDLNRGLWAMDVFANSSDSEAMPVTVLEALASGLPCVATAVGDLPQIAAVCPSIIPVPRRGETELADAIVRQLGVAGPAPVRREDLSIFTFETMMHNYVALYRRLLKV